MATIQAIAAAFNNVIVLNGGFDSEQHEGTRINGHFRATGRTENDWYDVVFTGPLGTVRARLCKKETILYTHNAVGDILSEQSVKKWKEVVFNEPGYKPEWVEALLAE